MPYIMAYDFSSILVILITIILLLLLRKAMALLFIQSNIPGPRGNWLFGQLFEIRRGKDLVQTFEEWAKLYGPIVEFRPLGSFGKTYYLINDVDAVKQILVSKSFKYIRQTLEGVKFFPHKHVFLANGKEHSRMRKMINPAFKLINLKSMVDVFYEKVELLEKHWNGTGPKMLTSNMKEGWRLSVQSDFARMSLDILGKCVFGFEFNTIEAGDTTISSAFNVLSTGVNVTGQNILKRKMVYWFPFLRRFMEFCIVRDEANKIFSKLINQVIHDKRENQAHIATGQKDLLDLLLEAVDDETGQGMDEEELFGQVFLFVFAGHETTSVTLSWIFYFLAQYPDVQERLRREVKKTLNGKKGNWEIYESIEYLTAVINESMRLRPPGATFGRALNQDDNILGYNIPANSIIVIPPYVLHRKPEYWSNPENFNPDRFLDPSNPKNRFAFLPFSSGPRHCVGYRFALMEIKVALSSLIQKFSFSMIPGMSFGGITSLTYKPNPNLELLVKKI